MRGCIYEEGEGGKKGGMKDGREGEVRSGI
jgi:hypothetical protein